MSEAKHTPGPWAIGEAGDLIVTWPCDEFICGDVAHVHDAHLIAAAPELLEACEALSGIEHIEESVVGPLRDALMKARAAIAKARGN